MVSGGRGKEGGGAESPVGGGAHDVTPDHRQAAEGPGQAEERADPQPGEVTGPLLPSMQDPPSPPPVVRQPPIYTSADPPVPTFVRR